MSSTSWRRGRSGAHDDKFAKAIHEPLLKQHGVTTNRTRGNALSSHNEVHRQHITRCAVPRDPRNQDGPRPGDKDKLPTASKPSSNNSPPERSDWPRSSRRSSRRQMSPSRQNVVRNGHTTASDRTRAGSVGPMQRQTPSRNGARLQDTSMSYSPRSYRSNTALITPSSDNHQHSNSSLKGLSRRSRSDDILRTASHRSDSFTAKERSFFSSRQTSSVEFQPHRQHDSISRQGYLIRMPSKHQQSAIHAYPEAEDSYREPPPNKPYTHKQQSETEPRGMRRTSSLTGDHRLDDLASDAGLFARRRSSSVTELRDHDASRTYVANGYDLTSRTSVLPQNTTTAYAEPRQRNVSPASLALSPRPRGLRNLGNTCYFNSVLQCLAHCQPVLRLSEKVSNLSAQPALVKAFVKAILQLWRPMSSHGYMYGGSSSSRMLSARALSLSELRAELAERSDVFRSYRQQDAHEALCILLDQLHESMNTAPAARSSLPPIPEAQWDLWSTEKRFRVTQSRHAKQHASPIDTIFGGWLQSDTICETCCHRSSSFSVFYALSVSIPAAHDPCDLEECLRDFCNDETLGDCRLTCSGCFRRVVVEKRLRVKALPEVLVIHIKRFENIGFERRKISSYVHYPARLRFPRECVSAPDETDARELDCDYRLRSFVCHSGVLTFGHYEAVALHPETNEWIHCNDSVITDETKPMHHLRDVYLLVYERC